mgnify:CR=1 FL=1
MAPAPCRRLDALPRVQRPRPHHRPGLGHLLAASGHRGGMPLVEGPVDEVGMNTGQNTVLGGPDHHLDGISVKASRVQKALAHHGD